MPVQTGGGSVTEGNASAGADFIGRDQAPNHGNQVHIAMERLSEVSEREAATLQELSRQIESLTDELTALTRALIGDSRFGSTGLVQQVREMDQTGKARERWRVVSTWVLVLLLLSQLVQGWLLWQVYALYWVIYNAVQMTGS